MPNSEEASELCGKLKEWMIFHRCLWNPHSVSVSCLRTRMLHIPHEDSISWFEGQQEGQSDLVPAVFSGPLISVFYMWEKSLFYPFWELPRLIVTSVFFVSHPGGVDTVGLLWDLVMHSSTCPLGFWCWWQGNNTLRTHLGDQDSWSISFGLPPPTVFDLTKYLPCHKLYPCFKIWSLDSRFWSLDIFFGDVYKRTDLHLSLSMFFIFVCCIFFRWVFIV